MFVFAKHYKIRFLQTAALTLSLSMLALPNTSARTQWDAAQQNQVPNQQNPVSMPGQLQPGFPNQLPNQMNGGFWKGALPSLSNRVTPGIMLTGILENTLSSAKSQPGDNFGIILPDGFAQYGMQTIPKNSRIAGVVTAAAPAAQLRSGQPGTIQVNLQSLILPDGTNVPFSGFIDNNPNHVFKDPPKKRNHGFSLSDTGQQIAGMMGSFTNGSGFLLSRRYRGNDFFLDKGETLSIRINKTVVLPETAVKPVNSQPEELRASPQLLPGSVSQTPSAQQGLVQPVVPGLVGAEGDIFNQPLGGSRSAYSGPEPF